MKKFLPFLLVLFLISCKKSTSEKVEEKTPSPPIENTDDQLTMVFASCNDQDMDQPLWSSILSSNPDVFVWGGDNIYADTKNMDSMALKYQQIKNHPQYAQLRQQAAIIATWDDHDYGDNDAGAEWEYKKEAQQLFLDFIDVPKDDERRTREGVYYSQTVANDFGSVKVIVLDTRYFRAPLKENPEEGKRYQPWKPGEGGTILGEKQWQWLEEELKDNRHDFTMIVSSIQFIAYQHPWEQWGNFPDEVAKMETLLVNAPAKNIFFVSGDRHLAELSKKSIEGLPYPLIDFTSSGMTKTYPENPQDENKYRVGKQVQELNFAWLAFDFSTGTVQMEVRGENNVKYLRFTCF